MNRFNFSLNRGVCAPEVFVKILDMSNSRLKKMPISDRVDFMFQSIHLEYVRVFEKIMKTLPPSVLNEYISVGGHTFLTLSTAWKSNEIAKILLKNLKVDVNKKRIFNDKKLFTPFLEAVIGGNDELVDYMLDIDRVDVTVKVPFPGGSRNAIDQAGLQGQIGIADFLRKDWRYQRKTA